MLNEYDTYKIDFWELNDFKLPTNSPFILAIDKQGINFEFLIRVSKSDKAIIFGSGAYDATSELKPPIFQRHKWMKHFEETLIYYNDPTLYLGEINMGWGFGSGDRHYLQEIAGILEVLLEKVKIAKHKTLFYGSSAGGYMSLILGGFIKGSKVLVNNPQTIVWNYYDRHVNAMFKSALPTLTRDDIIEKYADKLSVHDFYKKINYVPEIIYLQNAASVRDTTCHLNPFIENLADIDDTGFSTDINLLLYSDKKLGHSPLKIDDTLSYLKSTLSKM